LKCGNENPEGAERCNLCGSELQSGTFTKKSKKQLAALVFFSFVHYLRNTLIVLLLVVPVIVLVCFILWRSDAPPLEDDYTISDLRSVPAECERSYELLMSLSSKDRNTPEAAGIGLCAEDVTFISELQDTIRNCSYEETIEAIGENVGGIKLAWRNGEKGRGVISELNRFEEIADLTECSMDAYTIPLANLRRLAYLYHAYIFVEVGQGNEEEAMAELIELDMVFRKLSVNARPLVTKLVCIAVLALDIKTANFIVNNPGTSQESIELLAEHFGAFSEEQTSLRNGMINEYLVCKDGLDQAHEKAMHSSGPLKYNSTLRLVKNHFDELVHRAEGKEQAEVEKLSVWPRFWPFKVDVELDSEEGLPKIYQFYNPVGFALLGILTPVFDRVFELQTRLEVHGDLLQIVLGKRLGKEVSLRARVYSDEYIIDIKEGIIFSPGPDGEANTEDDIKLMINLEVLGLVE
jgi:hypothetical protein